jgi:hypothetical protein
MATPPNENPKSRPQFGLPTRKVGASGLAGAVSILLVWSLNSFVLRPNQSIPGEIASAITTVITFLVGYFIPEP